MTDATDAPKPKKKGRFKATAYALKICKKLGWTAGVVERHISFGGKFAKDGRPGTKIDLFGCLDVVALTPGETYSPRIVTVGNQVVTSDFGVLGLQVTSELSNAAARRDKTAGEPRARLWLACGNRIEVWAFPKHQRKGRTVRDHYRYRAMLVQTSSGEEVIAWEGPLEM